MLKEDLLEQVLDPENTRAAYAAVKRNGGKAGIDGIEIEQLGAHLRAHWVGIKAKLLEGRYKPAPVKPVWISKPGGGKKRSVLPHPGHDFPSTFEGVPPSPSHSVALIGG